MDRLLRSKYAPLLLPVLFGIVLLTHAVLTRSRAPQSPQQRHEFSDAIPLVLKAEQQPAMLRLPQRVAPISYDNENAGQRFEKPLLSNKALDDAVEAAWNTEVRRLPPTNAPRIQVDLLEEELAVDKVTSTEPEIISPFVGETPSVSEVPEQEVPEQVADGFQRKITELGQEQSPSQSPQARDQLDDLPKESPPAAAMAVVDARADELIQHAFSLAERGAFYSARSEFIQSLRSITQALDAHHGGNSHSRNLARGLRALQEADDFIPKGSRLEADLDVARIVSAHRTPVLKGHTEEITPLGALQRYYTYAQQTLAKAGGNQRAASLALYGLGKIYVVMGQRSLQERKLTGPKSIALNQAAMMTDSQNYRAANELGVLLARYGQLPQSRDVLLHSLQVRPLAETWHNLEVVHKQLGEEDLARRANYEWQLAMAGRRQGATNSASNGNSAGNGQTTVRWVDPNTFARTAGGAEGAAPIRPLNPTTRPPSFQPPPANRVPTAWRWPWQKSRR